MKHFIPTLVFLFSGFLSFAQFENFDLSKYKLPDIKRHQLTFYVDGDNSFSKDYLKDDQTTTENDLFTRFSGTYSSFLNSRKKQVNLNINFLDWFDFNKNKTDDGHWDKNKFNNSSISIVSDQRHYFENELLFLHVVPRLGYLHSRSLDQTPHTWNERIYDVRNINGNGNISPKMEIGIGYGRIEPVGDLRQALYILEDMQKNQRLEKLPDENEIVKLASRISTLKNKRFFDSRLRHIYEIKSLDSLMSEMGLIKNQDAVYFTSLNDLWLYGDEVRNSGKRLQLDLNLGLSYIFIKSKSDDFNWEKQDLVTTTQKDNYFNNSVGANFSFTQFKPIGVKWERYIFVSSSLNYFYHDIFNQFEYPSILNDYFLVESMAQLKYKWYLNTRTNFNCGLRGQFSLQNYKSDDPNFSGFDSELFGGFSYYISPHIQLIFNTSLNFAWRDNPHYNADKQISCSNRLSFTYQIF